MGLSCTLIENSIKALVVALRAFLKSKPSNSHAYILLATKHQLVKKFITSNHLNHRNASTIWFAIMSYRSNYSNVFVVDLGLCSRPLLQVIRLAKVCRTLALDR